MALINIDTGLQPANTTIAGGDIHNTDIGRDAADSNIGKSNQQIRSAEMSSGEELLLRDIRTLLIGNPAMRQNGLIDEIKELRTKLEKYIDADHANQEWRREVDRRLQSLEITFRIVAVLFALSASVLIVWEIASR